MNWNAIFPSLMEVWWHLREHRYYRWWGCMLPRTWWALPEAYRKRYVYAFKKASIYETPTTEFLLDLSRSIGDCAVVEYAYNPHPVVLLFTNSQELEMMAKLKGDSELYDYLFAWQEER